MPLLDLKGLSSLTFTTSGPTTDYTTVLTSSALGSSAMVTGPDSNGAFQLTFGSPIPADASGTWSLGAEARRTVQLTSSVSASEAAVNPVVTYSVDGSPPQPHRTIVDTQNCATCHGEFSKDFSIHGNLRNQVEYCELCHNSTQNDGSRRKRDPAAVAAGELTATIDFKVLIHKIHRGENLEQQPYLVYGFGSAPLNYTIHNFGEVLFPGDLRICETCHVEDSQLIPPYPATALPTLRAKLDPATGNVVPADPPQVAQITSVCTACHDGDDAIAHTETQTAPDGTEACPVCHQEGAAFAISLLHAGRN
jgi:OmcA/MtrC family decaheme c-type cytochrome